MGTLIVFEGADGVGKATQARLLSLSLQQRGLDVVTFSFPRYGTMIGGVIHDLLHRDEAEWRGLRWKTRALLFALDRLEALPELREALSHRAVVLVDRYVESNAAYHASEAPTPAEMRERVEWICHLEYEILGLPRPDATVLLELDPNLAHQLLRAERATHDVNETLAYQTRLQRAFVISGSSHTLRVSLPVGKEDGTIAPPELVHDRIVRALTDAGVLAEHIGVVRQSAS